MKRSHRRTTPLLIKHLKAQEERISLCGYIAKLVFMDAFEREEGSIYSFRFNNPYNFYL